MQQKEVMFKENLTEKIKAIQDEILGANLVCKFSDLQI